MKRRMIIVVAAMVGACAQGPDAGGGPAEERGTVPLDTLAIERLTGAEGSLDSRSGVFKVSVPREGLGLVIHGVRMVPALGLTSWAAFQAAPGGAVMAGDLVLLEPEVNGVLSAALDAGLEVTALHNHFFGDEPKVMFLHIAGRGPQDRLAAGVGRTFDRMRAAWRGEIPSTIAAEIDPAATSLDPAALEAALGARGKLEQGVYKVTIGRTTTMGSVELDGAMGVNTWAAFAGSDERAVVDGDFAVEEGELQPVLRALRGGDIQIVAIHHHMVGESPRIVFLHYWGIGPAAELAQTIRSALDEHGRGEGTVR